MSRQALVRLQELATRIKEHPVFWGGSSDIRYEMAEGLLESLPSFRVATKDDLSRVESMIEHLERILANLDAERIVA